MLADEALLNKPSAMKKRCFFDCDRSDDNDDSNGGAIDAHAETETGDPSNGDSDSCGPPAQPKKRRKTVHFAEFAKFRPIPSRADMNPLQARQLYLSEDDMRRTKQGIMETLRKLREAGCAEVEDDCIRGLERCIPSQCAQRTRRMSQCTAAVIQLQKLPTATPERLAAMYQQRAGPSVCIGYMRGALDHLDAIGRASPSNEQIESLQRHVMAMYRKSIEQDQARML